MEWISLVFLFFAGYYDWKEGIIPDEITIPFIYISLFLSFIFLEDFYLNLLITSLFLVCGFFLYKTKNIGGGDIKIITPLFLYYGLKTINIILFSSFFFFGYYFLKFCKKKKILLLLLIPAVFLGFFLTKGFSLFYDLKKAFFVGFGLSFGFSASISQKLLNEKELPKYGPFLFLGFLSFFFL